MRMNTGNRDARKPPVQAMQFIPHLIVVINTADTSTGHPGAGIGHLVSAGHEEHMTHHRDSHKESPRR
jgi:hypothetical protein